MPAATMGAGWLGKRMIGDSTRDVSRCCQRLIPSRKVFLKVLAKLAAALLAQCTALRQCLSPTLTRVDRQRSGCVNKWLLKVRTNAQRDSVSSTT